MSNREQILPQLYFLNEYLAGIAMSHMQKEISLDDYMVTLLKAVVSISGAAFLKSAILL